MRTLLHRGHSEHPGPQDLLVLDAPEKHQLQRLGLHKFRPAREETPRQMRARPPDTRSGVGGNGASCSISLGGALRILIVLAPDAHDGSAAGRPVGPRPPRGRRGWLAGYPLIIWSSFSLK